MAESFHLPRRQIDRTNVHIVSYLTYIVIELESKTKYAAACEYLHKTQEKIIYEVTLTSELSSDSSSV